VSDPSLYDMRLELKPMLQGFEGTDVDIEQAIYWFAYANHGGQDTNLYVALGQSDYKPGPDEREPSGMGIMFLRHLENTYLEG